MRKSITLTLGLLMAATAWAQDGGASADSGAVSTTPVLSGTVTPIPFPTDTVDAEYARRAGVAAVRQWAADFIQRGVEPKRFAVLPLNRDIDGGYFTEQVRNNFAEFASGTEYALFTRQDDATFSAILDEIRMGDQFGDTMDPSTIQQFGKLQGVEGIIMGRIAGVYSGTANDGKGGIVQIEGAGKIIQVRVSLQAYAVETGQLLWGAERIGSATMPAQEIVIKRNWILMGAAYGGGALFLLLLLWVLMGRLKSANRPR